MLPDMWDPPRPGIEPVSPVLGGRFFTTEPPVLFISGRSLNVDGENTSEREKLKTSPMEGVALKHRLRDTFSISFRNLSLKHSSQV